MLMCIYNVFYNFVFYFSAVIQQPPDSHTVYLSYTISSAFFTSFAFIYIIKKPDSGNFNFSFTSGLSCWFPRSYFHSFLAPILFCMAERKYS